MAETSKTPPALGAQAAYQLANVTKTAPQFARLPLDGCLDCSIGNHWKQGFSV